MLTLNSITQDPFFRRFYLRLVILFVILSALVSGAWYAYDIIQQDLKAQERPKIQKINSLRSQVQFLQQQVKLHYEYGDKYQELVKRGLVKQQDRVYWTDSLIKIKEEYLIPEMTFSFSGEKRLSSNQFASIKLPNGMFFYSDVKLKMSLHHEEDLVRVLESISQNITPLYLVSGCQVKLKEKGHELSANFDLANGNVKVDCSLIVFHTHGSDVKEGVNGKG